MRLWLVSRESPCKEGVLVVAGHANNAERIGALALQIEQPDCWVREVSRADLLSLLQGADEDGG